MRLKLLPALALSLLLPAATQAACCYFSAKNSDIFSPHVVFITWDPGRKSRNVYRAAEIRRQRRRFRHGHPDAEPAEAARDAARPRHLAVYTIMRKREFAQSKLLPLIEPQFFDGAPRFGAFNAPGAAPVANEKAGQGLREERKPAIKILEVGTVGSLDYKIIEAGRADDLFKWLKDNQYSYSGDEATLNHYVQKKWLFTVMKIDTMQMKRNKDGTFAGEVTPTRFQFTSEKLVYPLKITQISVREKTEALFYVQAPHKIDLPGDMTYQYTWIPMLQAATGCTPGGIKGGGENWLKEFGPQIPPLLAKANQLNFRFVAGQRPQANNKGHIPTTMEWARKLSKSDVGILTGKAPYCEKVPDPDEGFTLADAKDKERAKAIAKVIRSRWPAMGTAVRLSGAWPRPKTSSLQKLAGHLQGELVHHEAPQDFRARRDERRSGDGPRTLQRRGRQLGIRGTAARVAALILPPLSPPGGRRAGGGGLLALTPCPQPLSPGGARGETQSKPRDERSDSRGFSAPSISPMNHLRMFLLACWFSAAFSARADDGPILPRYQALTKSPGVKLRRILGAGEMPALLGRVSDISADGKTAAYVDYVFDAKEKGPDTRLLIWDVAAGRYRNEIAIAGEVTALALSPGGAVVVIATVVEQDKKSSQSVSLWDTASGKRLQMLGEQKSYVSTVAFSPQGMQVLAASAGQIQCWDLAKNGAHKNMLWEGNINIDGAAFFPDGKKILCTINRSLRVIDLTETDAKKRAAGVLDLTGHQDNIVALAIFPDGKTAVTASIDNEIRSWDLVKGKPLQVLKKGAANTWISLGLSDDGKTVVSVWAHTDSEAGAAAVSVWDALAGKEPWSRAEIYHGSVPIRVRGQTALIGGGCNVLTRWDVAKGVHGTIERTWGGPKAPIAAVAADRKGRLFSAGQDGFVHFWEKDEIVRTIAAHAEPILAIALNAKETQLFTASADKTVKVWDVESGKLAQTLKGHTASVTSIALPRDGKLAFTGSSDRSIKVWNVETGDVLATLTGHSDNVNAVAVAANGSWLASGSDDATIRLWPIKDGKLDLFRDAITLDEHKKAVTCLAFSPDGKTLVSGSQDQTLKVWDWAKGKLTRTVPGHKNWITSVQFADAGTLLTTSDDLSVCRWELASGKETGRIDFGAVGDCPRCLARGGADRFVVGTSNWLLFEFEMERAKK